ncbi:ureidoglycolate lyase [Paraburkholderia silvatlantica]|uniref:Ureidoglycolate lyase n=1 Tax=Paraburkholderia silvatlantica TaxID=321895 RepID=A0ABR6FTS1_9BURK|nr:ureidoglycolate lyase [Paraburkholderia silvatlantica]MBB2930803.1 ureidoglycolate lyase [Paraburkholderia silvatlantica]PVY31956.1 ureidoglycolate lyase [Paraburkholderia silvatlantica]PXW37527.1 ureidoglycolate lyase [Paraburkholderia silvatlantica]
MQILQMEPLTREAFAPFGDVIELDGARHFPINGGTTERFHDLAAIDVNEAGGRPIVSVFRAQPRAWPVEIAMMERHPLGSQAFVPLGDAGYAVVVAPAGAFDPAGLRAFWAGRGQGINYAKGVWHHPLLAFGRVSDFVVIDRGGTQPNCDEIALGEPRRLAQADTVLAPA